MLEWAGMTKQYIRPCKHTRIVIKQGHFWIEWKRRVFLEASSLEVLASPVPFPSIISKSINIKESRACSFEGCFLSSLLHPPSISSLAFVAALLPPAERAGGKPGDPAPAALRSCQGPRTHPEQPDPAPAALSCLLHQDRGPGKPSPPQLELKCTAWQQGAVVLEQLPAKKDQ